ncbi:MAG: monovalent cation/H+ antiporter complex subunit F [Firmicutes bacterium]|nr:monovalent cation/H+ antiporter complex subunit F [Bacillota bacterium]MDY4221779.1 monovalent cation/H+ antiporter complex subunit F [Candidatus Faecousia sp.]MDY6159455.1 monovalent cation/H+ antiporter complex subunit F [Candidatus Faecousia sp.]
MNAWFDYLLIGILFLLTAGLFFSLLRAIRGPRMADRILGINMTGSLTTAAIAVLAIYLDQSWLLDVCLIYCMISFLAVVVLAKVSIASHEEQEEFDDV